MNAAPVQSGQPAFLSWAAAGFGTELVRLTPHNDPGPSPGKKPTESGWQTLEVTPAHVARWAREACNVGLRTRYFPAVDVDVDDPEIARLCEAAFVQVFGETAKRVRGNSARRALLYRVDGEPFPKQVLKFQLPDGTFAKVEVLADGQQLAVAGLHASGAPNEWPAGQPEAGRLMPINAARCGIALKRLRARLEQAGCVFQPERPALPVRNHAPSDWERDAELIGNALSRLDPDMAYDEWVKVGMALHAKDSGSRGLDAWDSWSARGDKYPGRTELEKKWRTFKAGEIHFATLIAMSGVSAKKPAPSLPAPLPTPPKAGNAASRIDGMAAGQYEPAPLIPTGILALDKALGGGIPLNKLAVIAARTCHGKTATTVRLAVNMAMRAKRVVVLWCEDEEVEFDLRSLAVLSRTPLPQVLEAYRAKRIGPIWAKVPNDRKRLWRENCSTVRLERPTPYQIVEIIGGEHEATFLLDHIGEVDWGDGKKHELIGDGIRLIRRAALDRKCLFVALAQLNRDWDRRKASSDKPEKVRPCLSDIENSGQIEQVARVCIIAEKVMAKQGEEEVPTGEYRYHVFKPRIATAVCQWHEESATPDNPEPITYPAHWQEGEES